MSHVCFSVLVVLLEARTSLESNLDFVSCGADSSGPTVEQDYVVEKYPWLGILYYSFNEDTSMERATTMAVLIHKDHALVPSFDIDNIPRNMLSAKARVIFGEHWSGGLMPGRSVANILLHPEFKLRTLNTVALVKLDEDITSTRTSMPVCPPVSPHKPNRPLFNIIIEDVQVLTKTVRSMTIVNRAQCENFYIINKLSHALMRPTMSVCAVALSERDACVWEAGSALASRDPWGRWRLVGFGVRGPGCGTPSIYLDFYRYLSWIDASVSSQEYYKLIRLAPNHLVLRQSSEGKKMKFRESDNIGNCDSTEENIETLYREIGTFKCDSISPVKGRYRLQLTALADVYCISITTTGNVKGKSPPFMWIEHLCDRGTDNCHIYKNTTTSLDIAFLFTFHMQFMIAVQGRHYKEVNNESIVLEGPENARSALPPTMRPPMFE